MSSGMGKVAAGAITLLVAGVCASTVFGIPAAIALLVHGGGTLTGAGAVLPLIGGAVAGLATFAVVAKKMFSKLTGGSDGPSAAVSDTHTHAGVSHDHSHGRGRAVAEDRGAPGDWDNALRKAAEAGIDNWVQGGQHERSAEERSGVQATTRRAAVSASRS